MSYYRLLGMEKEPFSTSPDPQFLYLSRPHHAALYRLRIALELRRGLSVVAGDIGTGKTTLARRLSQILFEDSRFEFHPILNPMRADNEEFLRMLVSAFGLTQEISRWETVDCLAAIEKYLFQKGVEEKKTVVLLIDEAQQLSREALEVLRALLNYETNEFKLLQVILFGQMELVAKVLEVPNFWDRVSLKITLPPLDERQTREMIDFRMTQAGLGETTELFTSDAYRSIFRKTYGYPRRITMLCHNALEYLVMMDEQRVSRQVVEKVSTMDQQLLAAVV